MSEQCGREHLCQLCYGSESLQFVIYCVVGQCCPLQVVVQVAAGPRIETRSAPSRYLKVLFPGLDEQRRRNQFSVETTPTFI